MKVPKSLVYCLLLYAQCGVISLVMAYIVLIRGEDKPMRPSAVAETEPLAFCAWLIVGALTNNFLYGAYQNWRARQTRPPEDSIS